MGEAGSGGRPDVPPPAPTHLGERLLFGVPVAVFCLALVLPALQARFRFIPASVLAGVPPPPACPSPDWKGFMSGAFQKRAEEWCLKGNGLHGWMVRAGNQLCLSVFGQVSPRYNESVLAGREGQLFQPMYLAGLNRQATPTKARLRQRVRRLKRLQKRLEKRGVHQILMINPNVMALYPELMPGQYRDPGAESRPSTYDLLLPLLDREGVNYVDVYGYLRERRGSSPIRFFEPTGSHLNAVGSCLSTNLLLAKMEELSGKAMPRLACEPWRLEYPPRPRELDLVEIANLLKPEVLYRPAPYPEGAAAQGGSGFRPRTLFVGTSYLFAPVTYLHQNGLVGDSYLFFYYRSGAPVGGGSFTHVDKRAIDWKSLLLDRDFLVLESNQSYPEIAGFGFVTDALKKVR